VWCRGDIYVKRFLWGVDGVKEAGNEGFEELLGGVCDRVGSLIVVECDDEGSSVGSGERLGGVGWGIVVSKISERSNVENVRFASSAVSLISAPFHTRVRVSAYSFGNEARHEAFVSFVSMEWQASPRREVS
jgi:hypothetical protein